MSLLDSLGGSSNISNSSIGMGQQVVNNRRDNRMNNLRYMYNLLIGKNINIKDTAINLLNQNSKLNSQLKVFLNNNGVTDDTLKSMGINL